MCAPRIPRDPRPDRRGPWIYFCNSYFEVWCSVKNNLATFLPGDVYFVWPLEYLITKPLRTHEANVISNEGQIMQCIIMYATGMYSKLSKLSSDIYIFNFGYLSTGNCIYGSKDERINGYFSKPKGVRELKSLDNTALGYGYSRSVLARSRVIASTTKHDLKEQCCINTYVRSVVLVRISWHRWTTKDILPLSFPPTLWNQKIFV